MRDNVDQPAGRGVEPEGVEHGTRERLLAGDGLGERVVDGG